MIHSITKILALSPVLFACLLLLAGCDGGGGSGNVTIDAPALSGALKFLGVCSVICSIIWAASLVTGSNRYAGHRPRGRRRRP